MTETKKNLRAGVIGLGSMGRHHVRILRSLPGVDLVALADASGDRFGVAGDLPVCNTVEDFLANELDMAVVAVPTFLHEQIGLALADAGVNALIEKPIADTVAGGQKLAAAFAQHNLVGAVGYVERCNPAIIELKQRLADGQLGEVYQVQTRRQGPFPGRIADVGCVKDLLTHDVDATAFITGAHYTQVAAQTTTRSGRPHEDMVLVTGQLSNGVIVNHVVNWLSPFKERTTIVTGERGTLVADTLTSDVTFYANGTVKLEWDQIAQFRGVSEGDIIRYAIAKREPLTVENERFRDAVNGEKSPIVTMEQGVETLRVIEAVLNSAAKSQVCYL